MKESSKETKNSTSIGIDNEDIYSIDRSQYDIVYDENTSYDTKIEVNKNENNDSKKETRKTKFLLALCYFQIVVAVISIFNSLIAEAWICAFMWILVVIAFSPGITKFTTEKLKISKKVIIIFRIVFLLIAFYTTPAPTSAFEGVWKNEEGTRFIIDSKSVIVFYDDKEEKIDYSYDTLYDSDYNYIYEVTGTKQNGKKIVFRYYDAPSDKSLCIYQNNKCIDTYSKVKFD